MPIANNTANKNYNETATDLTPIYMKVKMPCREYTGNWVHYSVPERVKELVLYFQSAVASQSINKIIFIINQLRKITRITQVRGRPSLVIFKAPA